jgi:uncharacterized peroxidase-related enzyme
MAIIPYPDEQNPSPEAAVLFGHCEKLLGRVANAVRMSTHSPKVAQPLLGFLVAVLRQEVTGVLDMPTKALVILKTSMLNGCDYCVGHNSALGRSLGFDDDAIAAIDGDYRNSAHFTPAQKAAIAWAECLTLRTYRQNPQVMEELKKHFSEPQIVEITLVSGFFNMWNRFTDGLEIDLESTEAVGNIRKSRAVDPAAYVAYMRDCWWNEDKQ